MSTEDKNKVFSSEEIGKILNEATQIQHDQDTSPKDGLTKSEIIQLAKESGISEQAILHAIHNAEQPAIDTDFTSFIKSGKIVDISSIPVQATLEDWDEIAHVLHTSTGHIGSVKKDEQSFQWFQGIGLSVFSVSLEGREHKTRIQVMANLFGVKTLINIGVLLISILGLFAFGAATSGEFRDGFFFGINLGILSWFLLRRVVLKSYFEKQKQKVKELANSVSKMLGRKKTSLITIEEEYERDSSSSGAHTPSPKVKG